VAEFLKALGDYTFLQNALAAVFLSAVAAGIVGSFVVVRRITYLAGGIAHCVLGGMGAVQYIKSGYDIPWLTPLHGALIAAVLAAVLVGAVSLKAKEREDTVISGLWAIGMAGGILFLAAAPGYNQNLMSFLLGNILMVSRTDLWFLAGLDLAVLIIVLIDYKQLFAVCFDEEFARTRGINTGFHYLLLLSLIAVTVVLLVTVVGVVMVIALLSLPAATASRFTKTLPVMIIVSMLLTATESVSGLAISYGPDLPAGAIIVLLAGLVYISVVGTTTILKGFKY